MDKFDYSPLDKIDARDFFSLLIKEIQKTNDLISGIYSSYKSRDLSKQGYEFEMIKYAPEDFEGYGSFKFFKVNNKCILKPITNLSPKGISGSKSLSLADFIGIDNVIKDVFQNTIKFASGKSANNVLLWGDRGTGKSSLIRAIAKSFGEEPYISKVKFIEIVEDTAEFIYELITIIKTKPYRFVLIFDDIAFDADSLFYKKLKSILDGGLDELPENIIIYATSNKRHLTTEKFSTGAPNEDFIHPEEEVEEGLSLSDRFGLTYGLYSFDREVYLKIVEMYLKKYDIKISSIDMGQIRKDAINFAIIKGSRSGRTAKQFAISLIKD
ncbi:MAG: DUF815 domain-containing protein [Deltaproteobacteria bacterium]|jgi:predicted AAA+ superfamily ATPase|nr:ATP-binding protein [Deltaproteobacteria bacterium]MCL5880094.1 ATP-binding protein [Deltaproteobacteria bacterium]MDA8304855.1 DUF815 domain-containing protein [Deltaproteobacteria bacterium]